MFSQLFYTNFVFIFLSCQYVTKNTTNQQATMDNLQLIQVALLANPDAQLSLDPVDGGGVLTTVTFTCLLSEEQATELEQAQAVPA